MTDRDAWIAEGEEIILAGRRLLNVKGMLILNPASYRWRAAVSRWRERGKANGWTT